MKKSMIFVGLLAIGFANAQEYDGKVGINTNEPKATLDITPETNNLTGTTNEGILVPRLSKERVAKMVTPETSTLVYVNDITYTASGTATPADTRVALVDAVGYYQYNGTQWERLGGEPWKVYGTDKYATQNNQNIYQKGNVVASALNIPEYFLNIGEKPTEVFGYGAKYNNVGFISYAENRALDNSFFGKDYSQLIGSELSISSRGKNDGPNIGTAARINLKVGSEDTTKPYSSFFIFKYGGDQTPGKEAYTGTYLVNKDVEGSVLHFTEEGAFHFRNAANGTKYFTNEEGTVFNIHQNGNVGIGIMTDTPTNRLHIKADADPLKLEGLQSGIGETLVVDANGVIKKGTAASTNGVQNIASMECNPENRGKMNFIQGADGKSDIFGICMKNKDGNYYWGYMVGGNNPTNGTGAFGDGL